MKWRSEETFRSVTFFISTQTTRELPTVIIRVEAANARTLLEDRQMTIAKINRAIAFGCAVALMAAIAGPASARKPLTDTERATN